MPCGERFGEFHGEDRYTTKESERLLRLPLFYNLSPVNQRTVIATLLTYLLICRWQKRPCGRRPVHWSRLVPGYWSVSCWLCHLVRRGLGLAANFRQLITVLGVLAGAGIFNGVTKYVAQYHDNPQQLRRVVGTSSAWYLVSLRDGAGFCAGKLRQSARDCLVLTIRLVRLVALVQMGIAWGNLLLALMKAFAMPQVMRYR